MTAAAEPTLRELLESLGLQGTEELWEVERLARRIQAVREKAGAVDGDHLSRSSLLSACLLHDPNVKEGLESAKLDLDRWFEMLGFAPADAALPESVEERPIDPYLVGPALELYQEGFGGRPLDPQGLAWSILSTPDDGVVGRRLSKAHLDFPLATDSLRELLERSKETEIGRVGGHFVEGKMQGEADLVPVERLYDVPKSNFVEAVFTWARQMAADWDGNVLTSTLVLAALVEAGGNDPEAGDNVGALLFELLYRPASSRYKEALDDYLAWYREQPRFGEGAVTKVARVATLTPYLWGGVQEALRISKRVSPLRPRIHARHLLAGLLVFRPAAGEPSGTHQLLQRIGVPPARVARHLLAYLEENATGGSGDDDPEAWREILLAVGDEGMGAARGFVLPGFDAEGLEGRDLLGIDDDVASFARLLAARSLEPPLAVGLFGDWGTGKSFFMKKLQRRIDGLAELARRAGEAGEESAFHRDVVQVEFNAWHYVEANLWASLVTHIFETLNRHFTGPDGEQERWERLLEKLDEAQQLQSDAQQVLSRAERELEDARLRVAARRHVLVTAMRAAWRGVMRLVPRRDAELLRENLGAAGLADLREQLLTTGAEGRAVVSRWPHFRAALVRGLGSAPALGWAGAVVAVAVVLAVLASRLGEEALLGPALARIAEVTAVVGGIGTWLGNAVKRAHRVMDAVAEAERVVREELEGRPEGRALRAAEARVVAASEEVEERTRRLEELRAQLEELRPGRRLSTFLAERAASSDYHQHLGLAAVVRRDFEKLHELMHHRVRFRVPRQEAITALAAGQVPASVLREVGRIDRQPFPAEGGSATEISAQDDGGWWIRDEAGKRDLHLVPDGDAFECTVDWNLPNVERIVLYIDDLDRCPPRRVVEVLQAIHLLLAFPLFVVVVAVDSRWVFSALNLRYHRLWEGFPGPGTRPGPHDYLEKIFQVPFWLEPMTHASTRGFLHGLLAGSVEEQAPEAGGSHGSKGGGGDRRSPDEDRPLPAAPRPDDRPAGEDRKAANGEDQGESAGEDEKPPAPEPSEETAKPARLELPEELRPRSLELTEDELEFIESLAPIVGRTPRAVKRCVNVYRLIRAGITGPDLEAFLAEKDGGPDFKALALLLAILAGHPDQARTLFEAVEVAPAETPIGFVFDGFPQEAPIRRLGEAVEELQEGGALLPGVGVLQRWLPKVSRYSFRLGAGSAGRVADRRAPEPSVQPPTPGADS